MCVIYVERAVENKLDFSVSLRPLWAVWWKRNGKYENKEIAP